MNMVNYMVRGNGATETYITHFLEAARFPKAPVLADCQVDRIPPPPPHLTVFGPWKIHVIILSYLVFQKVHNIRLHCIKHIMGPFSRLFMETETSNGDRDILYI